MKALLVNETKSTPKLNLNPDGRLFLEGRSLPEDPITFYTPVLEWVQNCAAENVVVEMRMDYMNTSSTKELYTFFKLISENQNVKSKCVIWFYEEGDDDNYYKGREFELVTKIPFYFHEYQDEEIAE